MKRVKLQSEQRSKKVRQKSCKFKFSQPPDKEKEKESKMGLSHSKKVLKVLDLEQADADAVLSVEEARM